MTTEAEPIGGGVHAEDRYSRRWAPCYVCGRRALGRRRWVRRDGSVALPTRPVCERCAR